MPFPEPPCQMPKPLQAAEIVDAVVTVVVAEATVAEAEIVVVAVTVVVGVVTVVAAAIAVTIVATATVAQRTATAVTIVIARQARHRRLQQPIAEHDALHRASTTVSGPTTADKPSQRERDGGNAIPFFLCPANRGGRAPYNGGMPELPDIVIYIESLERRVLGHTVRSVRVASPSVLRTFDPPYDAPVGREVIGLRRVGKRIAFEFEGDLWLVIHLMVAGRLRWEAPRNAIPKKVGLAAVDFDGGTVLLTEQGTKRRAGIWLFQGYEGVDALDRGGVEPLEIDLNSFGMAVRKENRTLKRVLTDPRIFSGIGNAYSDEILWLAQLSPVKRTGQMNDEEVARLHSAVVDSLNDWTARLRDEVGDKWPTKVTAFRDDMSVHGKFGEPCPRCGSKVQRIVYASNETNYCATCQTGGKLLADRSLSRLLKDDWPKTIEELEEA